MDQDIMIPSLGTEVGLGSHDIVLDGDQAPPRKQVQERPLPAFRPTAVARSPISATAELLLDFGAPIVSLER